MRCACGTIANMTLPFVTREMRHTEDLCNPLAPAEQPKCLQRGCVHNAAIDSPFCEILHHNDPLHESTKWCTHEKLPHFGRDGREHWQSSDCELPGSSLNPGRKDDAGKTRYDLLPWAGLSLVAQVLTKGAAKYAPDNWRKVEGWRWRYFRAAVGHLIAWWGGEKLDPEWGLPHLAHAACCVLFLLELDHCTDVHVDTKSTDQ